MSRLNSEQSSVHQWGLRVGTEIVTSTMLGLGGGFLLDRWLDTRPLFLLLFFLFGVAAGFINLYHVMGLDRNRDGGSNGS
ncbi:MAG: AtpZ/AtpI family protein [Mariprofundus sp.]